MSDVTIGQRIFKDSFSHDLQAAALNHITTFNTDFRLSFIAVNRAGSGGNITFETFFDSLDGANFDVLIATNSIGSNGQLIIFPDYDIYFAKGDELRLEAPSLGNATTLHITIQTVQE